MVGGLEWVTFLFYLTTKKVIQMIYSMKLNGLLHNLFNEFYDLASVMIFIRIQVVIWFS